MMKYSEVKVCLWLARRLPHKLIYFCSVILVAHSASGKYGSTIVGELSAIDALNRYGEDFKIL